MLRSLDLVQKSGHNMAPREIVIRDRGILEHVMSDVREVYEHHRHEPEADVNHLVSSHPGLPEPS